MRPLLRDLRWLRRVLLPSLRVVWRERPRRRLERRARLRSFPPQAAPRAVSPDREERIIEA